MRDWPLSAVGTELLLGRPVARQRFALLTLKELVVCGVWQLRERDEPRRFLGPRRVPGLVPGAVPLPDRPPLGVLDAWLRRRPPGGLDLGALRDELAVAADVAERGLREARDDLVRRGLLVPATTRLLHRAVLRRTPLGQEQASALADRRAVWRRQLRKGGAAAAAALADLSAAPGLVPLVDPHTARALDRAWRDAGGAGGDVGGADGVGGVAWSDLGSLSAVDASFDSGGFDAGGDSGPDGGGDGGGGD